MLLRDTVQMLRTLCGRIEVLFLIRADEDLANANRHWDAEQGRMSHTVNVQKRRKAALSHRFQGCWLITFSRRGAQLRREAAR